MDSIEPRLVRVNFVKIADIGPAVRGCFVENELDSILLVSEAGDDASKDSRRPHGLEPTYKLGEYSRFYRFY